MSISGKHNRGFVSEDIAIIGMSCIFPGASDIKTYWQNIVNKVDAVSDPPDDWGGENWFDPESSEIDRIYCKRGGYLGDLSRFDPVKYGVMPSTVEGSEPEHFLALRIAYEALADAGVPNLPLNRERTEVIIGRGTFINRGYTALHQHGLIIDQTLRLLKTLHPEYTTEELKELKQKLKSGLPPFNAETAPGLVSTIMSGRIANRLDLKGAGYCVDSACSSSLTAVEHGVQDLLTGKCDAVLAGGIQLSTHHLILMVFSQLGVLSKSSQIRPFDINADGTLLGEGVGMVVLKRQSDAERDGNRIYALIKSVGSASDGRGKSVVAPRVEGEVLAIRRAYELAGIPTSSIGLIEAHGTAMPVGDQTEIQALGTVFGEHGNGLKQCAIGSVKSMIGHLIPAAGIAGLIKTALALYHKTLPPTLHCEQLHTKLGFEKTPFYMNTETRPWIHAGSDAPRRAGINAFGFGGINAHAVLEEYKEDEPTTESYYRNWETELFVFQGDSRKELIKRCEEVIQFITALPATDLIDMAYTINSKLSDKPYRLAIVAESLKDLAKKLDFGIKRLKDFKRIQIKSKKGIYFFEKPIGRKGKLAFLFPGEGSQYLNMLADLCIHFPEVRSCFDILDRAFISHPKNFIPSHVIFPPPTNNSEEKNASEEKIWRMDCAVDAVITADRALFRLLDLLKIRPQVVLGHSSGEFMALEAAGVLKIDSEEELIQHISSGNHAIESMNSAGKIPAAQLAAIGAMDRATLLQLIKESDGRLIIAMDNCPNQVVLCGDKETIAKTMSKFRSNGAICQILPFERPYHTALFKSACGYLEDFFNSLTLVPPKVKLYSCMTANPMPEDLKEIRKLAVGQWALPVRFRETIESMYKDGVRIFVEVGPRANLTGFVNDLLQGKSYLALAANVHHRSGITQLHHTLGHLAAHGVPMQLDYLYKRRAPKEINIKMSYSTTVSEKKEKKAPKLSLALPVLFLDEKELDEFRKNTIHDKLNITNSDVLPLTKFSDKSALKGANKHQDQVVSEYFHTMDQFLESQQEIMQTYLSQAFSGVNNISQPDIHHDVGSLNNLDGSLEEVLSSFESKLDGSVKPTEVAFLSKENLKTLLLSIISEKTGYPVDMIDLDHDLEADLGIDSIKRVEILGALEENTGKVETEEMDRLNQFKTLRTIIDFLFEHKNDRKNKVDALLFSRQTNDSEKMPFIDTVLIQTPGEELTAVRKFDLYEDIFLLDHTMGRDISVYDKDLTGLSIMPLTVSLEMMAEAATLLMPDKLLIGMKDIRAYRWITFENRQLTLKMHAKLISKDNVRVQIRDTRDSETGKSIGLPIIEGTMVFGDQYPEPPEIGDFLLKGRRKSVWTSDNLYSEGMFSGPSFQGVADVDWWGEDGIEATLQALPVDILFRSQPAPTFVSDPVLLDAAGQLVAYWIADHRETGFNVYPFRVEALNIYGPKIIAPEKAKCRAQIKPLDENQLRSDIDVIGADGRLRMRLVGWDDRSFDLPSAFYRIRFRPREVMLSSSLHKPTFILPEDEKIECCFMKEFPDELLNAHGGVWRNVLAHLVLSRKEREIWYKEKQDIEWLLVRVAGKDAIRKFLKKHYNLELCMADINIEIDDRGCPIATGTWIDQIKKPPSLFLSHAQGIGIALVSDKDTVCGIDIRYTNLSGDKAGQITLLPKEQDLLTLVNVQNINQWLVRIQSAKAAVRNMLNRVMKKNTWNLHITALNQETGRVAVEVADRLAGELKKLNEKKFQVDTLLEIDYIAACSFYREDLVKENK